jgi:predicted NodU family carbamoyl transferase
MQKAVKVKDDVSKYIPSAVHVDKTSRVQFVDKKISPKFWNIINEFYKISGLPVILNTSFNRHGISTICSPRQAIEHLLEGSIDILYLEKYKVSFLNNRKYKIDNEKIIKDEKLLKQNNIDWLKKNKILMNKKSIYKYKAFLKKLP